MDTVSQGEFDIYRKMARDSVKKRRILAVGTYYRTNPSSADVERSFSTYNTILSDQRHNLSQDSIKSHLQIFIKKIAEKSCA